MAVVTFTNPHTMQVPLEREASSAPSAINDANQAIQRYLELRTNPHLSWLVVLEAIREENLSALIFNGLKEKAGLSSSCLPQFAVFDEESNQWMGLIYSDENSLMKLTIVPISNVGLGSPRPPTALELAYTKHAFLRSQRK